MRLDSPGPQMLRMWARLSPLPGGRWLFGRLLGWMVPYSGALGAVVDELSEGRAELRLRERRGVRNHLGSVHAIALINLGELASGLAVVTSLKPGVQGIVIAIEAEYHRKARGEIFASARFSPPELNGDTICTVSVPLTNGAGETVATVTATWSLRSRSAATT